MDLPNLTRRGKYSNCGNKTKKKSGKMQVFV